MGNSQANGGGEPAEPVPAPASAAAAGAPTVEQTEDEPQAAAAEEAEDEPQAAEVPEQEHKSLFGRAAAAIAAVGTVRQLRSQSDFDLHANG